MFATCCAGFVSAQTPLFYNFSKKDGLPSDEVYHVMQSSDGYLWFSTDRGISRFDGKEFKNFSSSNSGLPDNTVFEIQEDPIGRLWFRTYSGKLAYYYKDSIVAVLPKMSFDMILSMDVDTKDTIWISGIKNQIHKIYFDRKKNEFDYEFVTNKYGLYEIAKGRILHSSGIVMNKSSSKEMYSEAGEVHGPKKLIYKGFKTDITGISVRHLNQSVEGGYWFTSHNQISKIESRKNCTIKLIAKPHLEGRYMILYLLNDGSKWVTTNSGVYLLDEQWKVVDKHLNKLWVTSAFADREGNTWFTSKGRGYTITQIAK